MHVSEKQSFLNNSKQNETYTEPLLKRHYVLSKNKICHMAKTLLFIAGLIAILTGCGEGLPKDIKSLAKTIPDLIKSGQSQVNKQENKYKELIKSIKFLQVKKIAIRENWAGKFDIARDELKRAKMIYDKKLVPLIKKNRPESILVVQQEIERIKKIINSAVKLSQFAFSRFALITETIENPDLKHSQAKKNAAQIVSIVNKIKTGSFAKANKDFPDFKKKINDRFVPVLKLADQSQHDLNVVTALYQTYKTGGDTDYAALTDSANAILVNLKNLKNIETKFINDMDQLHLSYTKILKDMKKEYFITIKRESWNENSDYYSPEFVTFQRQVSLEDYEILTSENINAIAVISAGFYESNFKSNIGTTWDRLSIDPVEKWAGKGHNAASFYLEDSKELCFHKYILEENGETRETDWEKVNADFYEKNLVFLGMAIVSKPYGVFEDEKLTQAAPPGMAYVGNSQYGQWQQDNSGNRLWEWYGKYAFFSYLFFPRPYFYPYNSWHGWNNNYRRQRPYFGKTKKGFQQFGTQGTFIQKSSNFQSTNFVKSGGLKRQSASVRGAGARLRGGGPNTKGK